MKIEISEQTLQLARAKLEALAVSGQTLNYREFARELDINISPVILTVTYVLEKIMREDAIAQRPIVSSVITQKGKNGIPRKGFFMILEELGMYHGDYEDEHAARWHKEELNRLKLYYQK